MSRRWRRAAPCRSRAGLAALLASAALVSAACSGNHHPATPGSTAAGPVIASGMASWYGPKFNGRRTASGERYDMHALTAAHPTLPFGTLVQVTNRRNGRQVVVRINDRGPFGRRRIIDLSYAAARQLDIVGTGTGEVELALVSRYDMPPPQPGPFLVAAAEPAPPPAATASIAAPAGAAGRIAALSTAQPATSPAAGGDARDGWRDPAQPATAGQTPQRGDAAPMAEPLDTQAGQTADPMETLEPVDRPAPGRIAAAAAGAASRSGGERGAGGFTAGMHFTVQVGAFGQIERATALQQSLAARYPAVAVTSDGTWNRVQIGIFGERDQAEAVRRDLSASGFDAIVVAAR